MTLKRISLTAMAAITCLSFGCKKHPATNPTPSTTVNDLIGNFSGSHFHKYKNTMSGGIYSDSSTVTDTFVISKVGADSFTLAKPYWDISIPAFIYNSSNLYTRSVGTTAFNDRLRELTIHYNTGLDSIYVQVHYVQVGSNILETWDSFAGKRQ